jgi:hypothetical protein
MRSRKVSENIFSSRCRSRSLQLRRAHFCFQYLAFIKLSSSIGSAFAVAARSVYAVPAPASQLLLSTNVIYAIIILSIYCGCFIEEQRIFWIRIEYLRIRIQLLKWMRIRFQVISKKKIFYSTNFMVTINENKFMFAHFFCTNFIAFCTFFWLIVCIGCVSPFLCPHLINSNV